jgi:hypothetical protein
MHRRVAGLLLGWVALLFAAAEPSLAANRHAFVVGIDRYDELPADRQLHKAVNDARAVGETLAELGFEVTHAENVGRLDLVRRWALFLNKIQPGDVAAFFFAGHGVEINGANYLLPRDVPRVAAGEEEVLVAASLALSGFLEQLRERSPQLALHIVDACRDNPFVDARGRSIGESRGLARIDPPSGTFVMFSAGAGQTALDRLSDADPDPNSVYTRVLLRHLLRPSLGLPEIAREVRGEVLSLARSVAHEQTPAYYDEVVGRFCPAGCVSPGGTAGLSPPLSTSDQAEEAWNAVKDTDSVAILERFITSFPGTVYGDFAQARIDELKESRMAAVPPSTGPEPELEPPPLAGRDLVLALQQELQRVGCSPGPRDGIWGRRTEGALENFVRATNLRVPTGEPTAGALAAIRDNAGRVCISRPEPGQSPRSSGGSAVSASGSLPVGVAGRYGYGRVPWDQAMSCCAYYNQKTGSNDNCQGSVLTTNYCSIIRLPGFPR